MQKANKPILPAWQHAKQVLEKSLYWCVVVGDSAVFVQVNTGLSNIMVNLHIFRYPFPAVS